MTLAAIQHAPVWGRTMPETPRKKIRLRAAARRFDIQATYLSRIAKSGKLKSEGVQVLRHAEYPEIVEFYEDEIMAWWKARHPDWIDPEQDLTLD